MCKRTGFEPEPRARVPRHEREAARPSASWAARSDNASGRHRGSPGHPHLIVVAYWRRASVHAEVARTSFLIYCNHAGRAKTTSMQDSEGATESSRACRSSRRTRHRGLRRLRAPGLRPRSGLVREPRCLVRVNARALTRSGEVAAPLSTYLQAASRVFAARARPVHGHGRSGGR